MRRVVLIVALAVATLTGAWLVTGFAREGRYVRTRVDAAFLVLYGFEDKTTWAPGYREDAFTQVRVGMTESRVLQLLGRPLRDMPRGERMLFFSSGPPDANYWLRGVSMDSSGRVTKVFAEYWVD